MRTTFVSTSKLKTNKIIGIAIFIALFCLNAGVSIMQVVNGLTVTGFTILISWGMICYKAVRITLGLKSISYDDSSVYYEKKGFEVQIPFEEIKDIEIKTLTGIYNINLYQPSQDGKKIPFKMSMWYPLNFKTQDEKVNVLRDKIERYKRTLPEKNLQGLYSYQIPFVED